MSNGGGLEIFLLYEDSEASEARSEKISKGGEAVPRYIEKVLGSIAGVVEVCPQE